MDQLDLENPKTIAEVENALTLFKDEIGATSPLIMSTVGVDGLGGCFVSAFDIGPGFYQKDGTVYYGPIQPEFKDYLTLMHDWYQKGLIDQDFVARDEDAWKRMLTTGESGAIIHSPDTVGAWMTDVTPMMGGYNPVLNEGDTINFRLKTFRARPPYAMAVTTECATPEIAVKFLNYGYTEEGYMLYNYGIEGETYNLVDGKAVYKDKMLNNPDWPVLDAILKFKVHIGPFLRFEHEGNPAINQTTSGIRQFWTESSGTDYVMPMVTLTAEEGAEYARIMNQVNTYQNTAVLEFILGTKPLDEFDSYVDDMEKLELGEVIEMEQAALIRYNNR
jgi:putative aldouronate transport system substrate-binding protein